MIAEKLDNYITSLQADERASLLKILKTIEANNPIESTDADELLDIAANEINADSTTLASIAAYAYISRENLVNLLETNTFGDEIGGILKGVENSRFQHRQTQRTDRKPHQTPRNPFRRREGDNHTFGCQPPKNQAHNHAR